MISGTNDRGDGKKRAATGLKREHAPAPNNSSAMRGPQSVWRDAGRLTRAMSNAELVRLLEEADARGRNTPLLQMAYVEALERGGTVAGRAEEVYQRRVRADELPFLNGHKLRSLRQIAHTLDVDLAPPSRLQSTAFDWGVLLVGAGLLFSSIAIVGAAGGSSSTGDSSLGLILLFVVVGGLFLYGAFAGKPWIFETVAVARQRGLPYALDRLSRAYTFRALQDETGCS